jgi:molybdopterin-guanine dinucleotide biosynthesis protein B
MHVFAVSGFSGTGKTTIIESILRSLVAQGHSVVTMKSSSHEMHNEQGTDTERYRHAGAKEIYYRGPSNRDRLLRDIVKSTSSDFLIIEGMKASPIPKFWCIGSSPIGDTIPIGVKAIISWNVAIVEDKYDIPIVDATDTEQIIKIIKKEAVDINSINI